MPDPATGAIVTTQVVGAKMQSDAAKDASKNSSKAAAEELAFAQQQYDDWQEVYGPIQDNLSEYYSNLSPEFFEAAGLESYETEYQNAMQSIERSLAQRGIDPSSGIAASLEAQSELDAAEQRAEIRRDAPLQAAEEKRNFLQIGMGTNPSSNLQNTLANRTSQASSIAQQQMRASGEATSAAVTGVGTALQDYLEEDGD